MTKRTKKIVITGLMAALTSISTFIRMQVPIGSTTTMVHLGNVFCILSGLILGPLYGGLAAGIGSFLFDILNPTFAISALFTFFFKFILAFICGSIAQLNKSKITYLKIIFAATLSVFIYTLLHLTKNFMFNLYLFKMTTEAALFFVGKSAIISIINAAISVIIAVPIAISLKKVLLKNNLI